MARVGLPVIFTNLTLTVMQVTDAWMLGALGSEALAAVTPPGLLIFLFLSFGYSFLMSIVTFVSQSLGKGNEQKCGHFAWQGIHLAMAIGAVALAFWPAGRWIFGMFENESPRVFEMEVTYFRISLFSLGPSLVTIAVSNFFIGVQRTRIAMVSSVVGLVTNFFLNYGLIFGSFGMPEWGFKGAAWGTVFATVFEAVILMSFFLSTRNARRFGTRRMGISIEDQKRMIRIGLPAGFQGGVDVASWGILLSWLVAFYGTAHQAAATVLIRCMQLSFMPAEGIAVASLTLVGSAVGERNLDLAEARARLAFIVVAAWMTSMGALFFVFRVTILEFFSDDAAVVAIGAGAMVFVSLFQFFDAMNISYLNALQAVGDNLWPSLVNVAFCLVVLLGGGLIVVHFFPGLGSNGIWALTGFYILGQGLAFRFRWMGGRWKQIDLFGDGGR